MVKEEGGGKKSRGEMKKVSAPQQAGAKVSKSKPLRKLKYARKSAFLMLGANSRVAAWS